VTEPVELPSITNSIGTQFKLVPAGTFMMGESKEEQHEVTLTKPFYMGVYEVTNIQWKQVMGEFPGVWMENDRNLKLAKAAGRKVRVARLLPSIDSPVEQTWKDAVEFCRKLSAMPEERKAGRVYRLPTEAEWECACRAGTKTAYSFGDDESLLGDFAWFHDNSRRQTHPVGQKKPNPWGLYDMHGNVREWCSDWHENYAGGGATDPRGPPSGSHRVFRGGSWDYTAEICRSAYRWPGPWFFDSCGFRLALSPSGAEPSEAKGD
jgi:formylglycine-generating enzyme required for sulfatase activity